MNLKINGIDYEMHFGLDFITGLDKKYYLQEGGIQLGQGLPAVVASIEMGNPTILVDLIQAATLTEKRKPSISEIKNFINEEVEDLEALMQDFLSAFEKSAATKMMMKKMGKITEKAGK